VPALAPHDARTVGREHVAFVDERVHPRATAWQPFVATLPQAELRGTDPAVFHEGRLVYESLWDRDHYERSHAALARLAGAPSAEAGDAASILSLWCGNYYHWLVDALPRLAVLDAVSGDSPAIVTPATPSPFQEQSLRALGIWERRLPYAGPRLRLASLTWPSGLDPIGFPSPRTAAWLRATFATPQPPEERPTRLYLRRSRRTVANPHEVSAVLERFGFEVVEPETLSFAEQVRTFSAAEAIVGCHGAGMANCVFARPGAHVLELFQPGYVNLSTYRLVRAAGMRYAYLVGGAAGPARRGKDRDVVVDTVALATLLSGYER
jgi:capsular polysaccharide biosynthesis protein